MSELGQMLRETRESRGISLAEAEEATRIRRKHLEALEDDKLHDLPPSVYVRGFLRSYAVYLGLDPEQALALYRDGVQVQARPREPAIISEPLVPGSPVNWELIAGVVMLIAVAVILILVYRQYVAPLAFVPAGPTPAATEDIAPAAGATPVLALNDAPTATPTVPATPTPPPTPVPVVPTATRTSRPTSTRTPTPARTQELTLSLKLTAPSWIRIRLDGETAFEGILRPEDERNWTARREIELRTGNAGGVVALVNGQELGVLGNSGQVLDYVWRLSTGGRVTMSTPTP